jgi:hypothetical protein
MRKISKPVAFWKHANSSRARQRGEAARALNLVIPTSVVFRADEVID